MERPAETELAPVGVNSGSFQPLGQLVTSRGGSSGGGAVGAGPTYRRHAQPPRAPLSEAVPASVRRYLEGDA
jgi:hypothetical protein